jgi:hypothetical protein
VLTQDAVSAYLLGRGLIHPRAIVDGDLTVTDASRRNQNFRVTTVRGPCYLLKQGVGFEGEATVAHEGAVYDVLRSLAGGRPIDRYLPSSYGYDEQERLLVLELLRDSEDLGRYHARRRAFSTLLAAGVGTALAGLHRTTSAASTTLDRTLFPGRLPWVLFLDRPSPHILRDSSGAAIELIRILQSVPELRQMLRELRLDWRAEALVHFDLKWDNCLVLARPGSRRATRLTVIDWEFADVGDPCWDAGAMLGNYLSAWLMSIPITGDEPPDRFLELARFPLTRMHPAIRAFWRAYATGMGLAGARSWECLLRAVRYAAARLIQTCYEHLQTAASISGDVVCLLQLSLNMAQRPSEAATHLLGIAPGEVGLV